MILLGKPTLISAVDGVGKTHLASIIVEEIANKNNIPIVIFDQNNEYGTIGTAIKPTAEYPFSFVTSTINADSINNGEDAIIKKIKLGQVTIITAENLSLKEKTDCYTDIIIALAKSRREKNIPPFLLVAEESENLSNQSIQEIFSGKSVIATVLITSHPTMLGGKILSQTQNQIMGKTCDPQDLKYLKKMSVCADGQLRKFRGWRMDY